MPEALRTVETGIFNLSRFKGKREGVGVEGVSVNHEGNVNE